MTFEQTDDGGTALTVLDENAKSALGVELDHLSHTLDRHGPP